MRCSQPLLPPTLKVGFAFFIYSQQYKVIKCYNVGRMTRIIGYIGVPFVLMLGFLVFIPVVNAHPWTDNACHHEAGDGYNVRCGCNNNFQKVCKEYPRSNRYPLNSGGRCNTQVGGHNDGPYHPGACATTNLPPPPPNTPPGEGKEVMISIWSDPRSPVSYNQPFEVRYLSLFAERCQRFGTWSGPIEKTVSYGQTFQFKTGTYGFGVVCGNKLGNQSVAVTVNVLPPKPSVSLSANPNPAKVNQTYRLYWETSTGEARPDSCASWGSWSGPRSVPTGEYRDSGSSVGYKDYVISCKNGGGSAEAFKRVNIVKSSIPLPPVTTCKTNECSPNQCWNSGQTRPCVKDNATGNYCWGDPILNCVSGSNCEGGVCVGGPVSPLPGAPGGPGGPGGPDVPGVPGGPGEPGGGAGGPAFGSTQCFDGKDNDLDRKTDGDDLGCLDSSGAWNKNDNNEFNFRIREVIPDFFNLNWFKVNVASFLNVEALAK